MNGRAVSQTLAQAARSAGAALPEACRAEFGRLLKLVWARPNKFQLLIVDCRDERLRDRLIAALDEALLSQNRLGQRLNLASGQFPGFADLEQALSAAAKAGDLVHILGATLWLDDARREQFNIRREAIAQNALASLVLWLNAEHIAALAGSAVDLWAWRAAVLVFDAPPEVAQMAEIPVPRDVSVPDARDGSERGNRVIELKAALASEPPLPESLYFGLALELGDILVSLGRLRDGERVFRELAVRVKDDEFRHTVIQGRVADILYLQGKSQEAKRVWTELVLPVFEKLGDDRSRAVTLGKIADVLQVQGQPEGALNIYRNLLPVFDKLDDMYAKAVTQGRIADILDAQGQLAEALRIQSDDVLPVYERMGNIRERALTLSKIADLLDARGEIEEALRIYREGAIPLLEQLGVKRELLIAQTNFAVILLQRGREEDKPEIAQLLEQAGACAEELGLKESVLISKIYKKAFGKDLPSG